MTPEQNGAEFLVALGRDAGSEERDGGRSGGRADTVML